MNKAIFNDSFKQHIILHKRYFLKYYENVTIYLLQNTTWLVNGIKKSPKLLCNSDSSSNENLFDVFIATLIIKVSPECQWSIVQLIKSKLRSFQLCRGGYWTSFIGLLTSLRYKFFHSLFDKQWRRFEECSYTCS